MSRRCVQGRVAPAAVAATPVALSSLRHELVIRLRDWFGSLRGEGSCLSFLCGSQFQLCCRFGFLFTSLVLLLHRSLLHFSVSGPEELLALYDHGLSFCNQISACLLCRSSRLLICRLHRLSRLHLLVSYRSLTLQRCRFLFRFVLLLFGSLLFSSLHFSSLLYSSLLIGILYSNVFSILLSLLVSVRCILCILFIGTRRSGIR